MRYDPKGRAGHGLRHFLIHAELSVNPQEGPRVLGLEVRAYLSNRNDDHIGFSLMKGQLTRLRDENEATSAPFSTPLVPTPL